MIEAVKKGDAVAVETLLREDRRLVSARAEGGASAILLAVYYGHAGLVDLFEAHGATLDLFEACAAGRLARAVECLVAGPGLANTFAPDGFTPLGLAAFFGHAAIVARLLEGGADVNLAARNAQRVAPLHSAAARKHVAIVRALLDHGADPDARQAGGFTAMHAAAANGDRESAELLLGRGADPNARTDDGRTPADLARERGQEWPW